MSDDPFAPLAHILESMMQRISDLEKQMHEMEVAVFYSEMTVEPNVVEKHRATRVLRIPRESIPSIPLPTNSKDKILAVVEHSMRHGPHKVITMLKMSGLKNSQFYALLKEMVQSGDVEKVGKFYQLPEQNSSSSTAA